MLFILAMRICGGGSPAWKCEVPESRPFQSQLTISKPGVEARHFYRPFSAQYEQYLSRKQRIELSLVH